MDLDAVVGELGQGAVHQQALVEQAGGSLDDVRAESAGHAHRIVRGVDGNAYALEQTRVAHGLHAVPHGRSVRAEQVAGLFHQDGVGAFKAQALERVPGLGLDEVGAAVAAGGLDHHAERTGPGHQFADHPLGAAGQGGVQHRDSTARGDGQHLSHLRLRRASARIGDGIVEAKLGRGQAKLGATFTDAGHGCLFTVPPVYGRGVVNEIA